MTTRRLTSIARKLRRERTKEEDRLWYHLRNRQVESAEFRFQHPVGRSIGDFICESAKLVIELDGSQHATQSERDALRTRSLEQAGYRVLRYWNSDVLENLDGVLADIRQALLIARNA